MKWAARLVVETVMVKMHTLISIAGYIVMLFTTLTWRLSLSPFFSLQIFDDNYDDDILAVSNRRVIGNSHVSLQEYTTIVDSGKRNDNDWRRKWRQL